MTEKFHLSHSQIELYTSCPEKWFKVYPENRKIEPGPALEFGSNIHLILADCLRHNIYAQDAIENPINGEAYNFGDYDTSFVTYMINNALDELNLDCVEIKLIEAEIENNFFRGIIDLVYLDRENRLTLLDWKTTSNSKYLNPHNADQLTAYASLYQHRYGLIPEKIGYAAINKKTGECDMLWSSRTMEDIKNYRSKIRQIYNLMWEHQVRYKNPSYCNAYFTQCPFYDECWGDDG